MVRSSWKDTKKWSLSWDGSSERERSKKKERWKLISAFGRIVSFFSPAPTFHLQDNKYPKSNFFPSKQNYNNSQHHFLSLLLLAQSINYFLSFTFAWSINNCLFPYHIELKWCLGTLLLICTVLQTIYELMR